MIRFDELVNKVETLNRQNREQMVQQIMPYLEVMGKKAMFEYEKQKERAEYGAGLKNIADSMGMPFTGDPSAPVELQKTQFGISRERWQPTQDYLAAVHVLGQEPAAGYDKMSPERLKHETKRAEKEWESMEMLKSVFAAHPDIEKALADSKEYNAEGITYREKYALAARLGEEKTEAKEWATWLKKQNATVAKEREMALYRYNLAMQKEEEAAAKKPPTVVKDTQAVLNAKQTIKTFQETGYRVGGHNVRVHPRSDGGIQANTVDNDTTISVVMKGGKTTFHYKDKGGKWRKLKESGSDLIKTEGRNKTYKGAKKDLLDAVGKYQSSQTVAETSRVDAQPQQPQSRISEFDWLFEGVQ